MINGKTIRVGKKTYVTVAAAAFMILVLALGYKVAKTTYWRIYNKEVLFSVEIRNEEHSEIIRPSLIDGSIYFFLPACAEAGESVLLIDTPMIVTFEGKWIRNGINLSCFEADKEYKAKLNGCTLGNVVFMYGDGLPSMFIDTESGNIDYLCEDKENKESGSIRLIKENGDIEYDGNLKWISGRGNSTWNYDKKPWTIKLEEKTALLGMNTSNKWVLIANVLDDTAGLRNYIAYNMAKELGLEFSRDLRFVNLYLNGEYNGLYLLTERIQISDNELDIGNLNKQNEKANNEIYETEAFQWNKITNSDGSFQRWADIKSPDNITGGYILERNYGYKLEDKESYFVTPKGEGFVIRDPSVVSEEESDYIFNTMSSVERALYAEDFTDPETKKTLNELIDIDSWVLKYLVDEVTKNQGMGTTSSYFYKKKNDPLIYAGPVWDYDKSFGNYSYWKSPEGITAGGWHDESSEWWEKFYGNQAVRLDISKKYVSLIRPYICSLLQEKIDEYIELISSSYQMNYYQWKSSFATGVGSVNLRFFPGDLESCVDYLKDWLAQRMNFLDSTWIDGIEYCNIIIKKSDREYFTFVMPKGTVPDENFWEKIDAEAEFYCSPTDEIYDKTLALNEDNLWLYIVMEDE